MKALFKAFLWLFFALAVIAVQPVALFLISGGQGTLSQDQIKAATKIFASVLALASAGPIFAICFRLARALIPRRQADDDSAQRRLIALAITFLLFPDLLSSIATTLAGALETFISGMTLLVMETNATASHAVSENTVPFAQGMSAMVPVFQNYGAVLARFSGSLLRSLSFEHAALAYAVWLLLYYLQGMRPNKPGDLPTSRWLPLQTWLARLDDRSRHNLSLAVLFFLGAYLSIAAIVAIPSVQHQNPDATDTKEKLQQALQQFTIGSDEFSSENYNLSTNVLEDVNDFLTNYPGTLSAVLGVTNANAGAEQDWRSRVEMVQGVVRRDLVRHQEDVNRWPAFRLEVQTKEQSLLKEALSSYSVDTLSPMPNEERVIYFRTVIAWHRNNVEQLRAALHTTASFLEGYDANLGEIVKELRGELTSELNALRSSTATASSSFGPNYFLTLSRLQSDDFSLNDRYGGGRRPFELPYFAPLEPPSPGAFAGPFAFIARWLLNTRSFALALITGMIGFGLLGASIGAFIRSDLTEHEGGPANSTTKVLVQGFSAAIVVFLGVQGGLAAFTAGEKEPNGYVVCFACLVGAVFSEHVWRWARQRLRRWLPNEEEERQQAQLHANKLKAAAGEAGKTSPPAEDEPPSI